MDAWYLYIYMIYSTKMINLFTRKLAKHTVVFPGSTPTPIHQCLYSGKYFYSDPKSGHTYPV